MPAGMTHVCELIRFSYPQDDVVGGAVPSGTVLYQNLSCRIEPNMPTQVLLEQGLEVPTTFQILIHPGNIEANHNDQIRITAPATSRYYNKKYRVIGLTEASSHPANDRNLIKFILKRWEASHGEAYQ